MSIEIAVALLSRSDGRTLVVRKRGTTTFIQPGGKIESGELPAGVEELAFAGRYHGPAVNEPGR